MGQLIYPYSNAPLAQGVVKPGHEEMLPVIEENGMVIAQAPRSVVHGGSFLLHPVVHLHIIDRFGRICLQKRSDSKKLLPGYWDTAVGGHVSYGESISEALFREASEELGLYDFNPISLGEYVYESDTERELVHVFAAVGSYELKPDPEEVTETRMWTPQELNSKALRSSLTPNFQSEYKQIAASLQALL